MEIGTAKKGPGSPWLGTMADQTKPAVMLAAAPAGPVGPAGPCEPVLPVAPVGPAGPVGPVAPVAPALATRCQMAGFVGGSILVLVARAMKLEPLLEHVVQNTTCPTV